MQAQQRLSASATRFCWINVLVHVHLNALHCRVTCMSKIFTLPYSITLSSLKPGYISKISKLHQITLKPNRCEMNPSTTVFDYPWFSFSQNPIPFVLLSFLVSNSYHVGIPPIVIFLSIVLLQSAVASPAEVMASRPLPQKLWAYIFHSIKNKLPKVNIWITIPVWSCRKRRNISIYFSLHDFAIWFFRRHRTGIALQEKSRKQMLQQEHKQSSAALSENGATGNGDSLEGGISWFNFRNDSLQERRMAPVAVPSLKIYFHLEYCGNINLKYTCSFPSNVVSLRSNWD